MGVNPAIGLPLSHRQQIRLKSAPNKNSEVIPYNGWTLRRYEQLPQFQHSFDPRHSVLARRKAQQQPQFEITCMRRQNCRRIGLSAVVLALHALVIVATAGVLLGQTTTSPTADLRSGEKIFKSGCVACHGPDATGMPKAIAGFEPPRTFPDFTACDQTTPEPDTAWKAIITHGGPTRGFSQIMPSFSEALTSQQMDEVIKYLRAFCRNPHWPRGELNLPRALVTEKAFPEKEEVISTAVNAHGTPGVMTHIVHEQRFGIKNQLEVDVPITFEDQNHTWYGGVGDATIGVKRVMFSTTGSILSLFGGVLVPSGNRARGFGTGTTTFETFAAFDHLFSTNTFIQTQFGAELPRHTQIAPQSIFFNGALGQSFAADHGLGRLWSPMVEFVAARDLVDKAKTDWDTVPQLQVTISRRQHIRADLGLRVPVNNTAGRSTQVMFYILWDWQDGRLNEGW
jgi:mono/diheme cytochrome c family protein